MSETAEGGFGDDVTGRLTTLAWHHESHAPAHGSRPLARDLLVQASVPCRSKILVLRCGWTGACGGVRHDQQASKHPDRDDGRGDVSAAGAPTPPLGLRSGKGLSIWCRTHC